MYDGYCILILGLLVQVYDNEWNLIEYEIYRVLADAVFESREEQVQVQVCPLSLCLYGWFIYLHVSNWALCFSIREKKEGDRVNRQLKNLRMITVIQRMSMNTN